MRGLSQTTSTLVFPVLVHQWLYGSVFLTPSLGERKLHSVCVGVCVWRSECSKWLGTFSHKVFMVLHPELE